MYNELTKLSEWATTKSLGVNTEKTKEIEDGVYQISST